jgi:hypothetical protein
VNGHEEFSRPLSGSLYYADLCFSFTVRLILYASILVCTGMLLVGCGRIDEGNPFSRDTSNLAGDREPKTQNILPQGGEYEKSDCAPRKPSG